MQDQLFVHDELYMDRSYDSSLVRFFFTRINHDQW